ncbi:hypothetical protein Poly30_45020 [Planctomycetes bacterium Poly30]|uniref:DUF4398 domain-containing protein n=1 Tax=Saltatorellus ferox TaxID=2528018 RepID=A0A518EXX3_9BACT|nr:hypothetical protein Poly30_45020 [Planctomycetes bacterium Poly30]
MKLPHHTTLLGPVLLALLAAGCAHTGSRSRGKLDDGLLQFVDPMAKQEVQEARVAHMQAKDERAAAEYRVQHADSNRRVLNAEKRAAAERVKLERERVASLTDVETGTEAPAEVQDSLASAARDLQASENRIELHEAQLEVLRAELALAKAEEAHAAAVVDVWKARALKSLNNEQSGAIDIFAYESEEHDCGTEIEIAKIRLWSAQSKVQTLEDRLANGE